MVQSIPTFRLTIDQGTLEAEQDPEKLFGYCIEATRGPVLVPTFVSSNDEAKRIFGVDFAPHFYQKPTGLILTRVKLPNMEPASKIYYATTDSATNAPDTTKPLMKVTAVNVGTSDLSVSVTPTLGVKGRYNLNIKIKDIISRSYQGLNSIQSVCKRINEKFGDYLTAEFTKEVSDYTGSEYTGDKLPATGIAIEVVNDTVDSYKLTGGSNGGLYDAAVGDAITLATDKTTNADGTMKIVNDDGTVDKDSSYTAMIVYRKAFEVMKNVDLIGLATLSDLDVVRNELIDHIVEMNDPEVNQLRFGVTAYLDYYKQEKPIGSSTLQPVVRDVVNLSAPAVAMNNEYMIFIGQGLVFKEENTGVTRDIPPHEAVQFYTGIRSGLDYSEAIFGGEQKKVLNGVVDVLPLTNDGVLITKDDREQLNESGVTTFKKEYDDITFLEGVTTIQDHDVLSYESIMSIVVHVSKRLITIAKRYQGQKLNEDLKASLETALNAELKNITETDKSLIGIDDYSLPPYAVTVKSAVIANLNSEGQLERESKVIIQARIVPVGALRDIDLGVIVI